jgi:hypothetical protein
LRIGMLGALKKFFSSQAGRPDWAEVSDWSSRQGHGFRRARDDQGFVIEGNLDAKPWRLEWGPPQRSYIKGHELRLRMELALPSDMQMLVLSRPLMGQLERQTFENFTEGNQTQIDTETPEEMRWLVMFPRVPLTDQPMLRAHLGAVASEPDHGLAWLSGPLAQVLERSLGNLLLGDPPFVLMTLRGRTYLRLELDDPSAVNVAAAIAIFEAGVTQAMRVAGSAGGAANDWPTTSSTAWQSLEPIDPVPPRR